MKSYIKLSLSLVTCLLAWNINAQEEEQQAPSLDAGSISGQFEYVIEESNNYQQYEVIPRDWMTRLRSHVNDTLQDFRGDLNSLRSQLRQQQDTISQLVSRLQSTRDTLDETRIAQDQMHFLGIAMSKSSYRLVMWSIVGVLVLLLLIFIYRFNRSIAITRQSKEALASVQDEFDQHRKRSLEREQKLRRELQDELNKQRRENKG